MYSPKQVDLIAKLVASLKLKEPARGEAIAYVAEEWSIK
jgi:hypothetical protein